MWRERLTESPLVGSYTHELFDMVRRPMVMNNPNVTVNDIDEHTMKVMDAIKRAEIMGMVALTGVPHLLPGRGSTGMAAPWRAALDAAQDATVALGAMAGLAVAERDK